MSFQLTYSSGIVVTRVFLAVTFFSISRNNYFHNEHHKSLDEFFFIERDSFIKSGYVIKFL